MLCPKEFSVEASQSKQRVEERLNKKYYSVVLFPCLKTHIFFLIDLRPNIALLICK